MTLLLGVLIDSRQLSGTLIDFEPVQTTVSRRDFSLVYCVIFGSSLVLSSLLDRVQVLVDVCSTLRPGTATIFAGFISFRPD